MEAYLVAFIVSFLFICLFLSNRGMIVFGIIVLFITITIGYFVNIYKVTQYNWSEPYRAESIRCIGIIMPPIGGVIGYIKIEDQ